MKSMIFLLVLLLVLSQMNLMVDVEKSNIESSKIISLLKSSKIHLFSFINKLSNIFPIFQEYNDLEDEKKQFFTIFDEYLDEGFHVNCFQTEFDIFLKKIFILKKLKKLDNFDKLGDLLKLEKEDQKIINKNLKIKEKSQKTETDKKLLEDNKFILDYNYSVKKDLGYKSSNHFKYLIESFEKFLSISKKIFPEDIDFQKLITEKENSINKLLTKRTEYNEKLYKIESDNSKIHRKKRLNISNDNSTVDIKTIKASFLKESLIAVGFKDKEITAIRINFLINKEIEEAYEILEEKLSFLKNFSNFCEEMNIFKRNFSYLLDNFDLITKDKNNLETIVKNEKTVDGKTITIYGINHNNNQTEKEFYMIYITTGFLLKAIEKKFPDFEDLNNIKNEEFQVFKDKITKKFKKLLKREEDVLNFKNKMTEIKQYNFIIYSYIENLDNLDNFNIMKNNIENHLMEDRRNYIMTRIKQNNIYQENPVEIEKIESGNYFYERNKHFGSYNDDYKVMEDKLAKFEEDPGDLICVYKSNFKKIQKFSGFLGMGDGFTFI